MMELEMWYETFLLFRTRNLKPCCHSGKVAVITGGTSRIGTHMAEVFVANGAKA